MPEPANTALDDARKRARRRLVGAIVLALAAAVIVPVFLESDPKPLGFWLRTVDALLSQEFATAFDGTGASRRDWMILNILSGDVDVPGFAERLARKGKRLGGLAERGWAEPDVRKVLGENWLRMFRDSL